jgi:hypothetical protein
MPYIAFPNTAQASLNWLLNGQHVQNNLYFYTPTGWNSGELSNLNAFLFDWVDQEWLPLLSQDIRLKSIVSIDRETSTGARVETDYGGGIPGSDVNDAIPNQSALVMSFLTEQRGRAYRGRNYIAGLCDNHVVNGLIEETTLSAWLAVFNGLNSIFGASDIEHVIASASLVDPDVGGTGFTTEVSSYRANASPGVRRSRKMP